MNGLFAIFAPQKFKDNEKGSLIYNNALLWYVGDGTDDDRE